MHKLSKDLSFSKFRYIIVSICDYFIYRDIIIYVHRVKRRTEIVLKNQEPVMDGRSLANVFSALDDPRYVYIEYGCFINMDYLSRVTKSQATMKNGDKLAISRGYLPKVKDTIFQLWGETKE